MIEIEIDGVRLDVPNNSMIIEAADNAGIHIPRFCYHKKLTIAANCRTCLVEVEKVGKPLPACATPVSQGMRIFTHSARALEAQRAVMEFLLINHPLDCPVCDQGGECELQDISMGYGSDRSNFTEPKRAVADENLGPLIASNMTRCIHCTRCVRFGQEIAGVKELGAMGRGEHMEIGTYVKHMLSSELSGNIIDLCPVGALTSKPFRFSARSWELIQAESIAPHDAVGSNIYIHTGKKRVMRVVPREHEEINETWISDRDRFSYMGIYHSNRLENPMIKVDGVWQEDAWPSVLTFVATQLKRVIETHGVQQIGVLGSPSATLEECYLLQKLCRALEIVNLDHRIHQCDFTDQANAPLYPSLNKSIAEIENNDAILLIGSNIHHEQPLMAHRVRKATLQGTKCIVVNPMQFDFNFATTHEIVTHPFQIVNELAAILSVLDTKLALSPEFKAYYTNVKPNSVHLEIATQLKESQKPYVLLGAVALNHPQASVIRWLANNISRAVSGEAGELSEGGNAAGAWLAGLVPHRGAAGAQLLSHGLNAQEMFANPLKSYLLMGVEPALDCANPQQVETALAGAEFVVALSPFKTKHLMEVSDILLPAATFAETSGTMVNAEGRWQSFKGSVEPFQQSRPIWKILRVLGNLLNLEGFDYNTSEEVRDALQSVVLANEPEFATAQGVANTPSSASLATLQTTKVSKSLTRITEWPIYRVDALVRHSEPLQKGLTQRIVGAYINRKTAKELNFSEMDLVSVVQNTAHANLSLFLDDAIPDDCVFIPAGYEETATLGENFGEIVIHHA